MKKKCIFRKTYPCRAKECHYVGNDYCGRKKCGKK